MQVTYYFFDTISNDYDKASFIVLVVTFSMNTSRQYDSHTCTPLRMRAGIRESLYPDVNDTALAASENRGHQIFKLTLLCEAWLFLAWNTVFLEFVCMV